jgi:hypothetical protein
MKTQEIEAKTADRKPVASTDLLACPVCDMENPMTSGEEGPFDF